MRTSHGALAYCQPIPNNTDLSAVIEPAFAPPKPPFAFWQDLVTLLLLGALLGCVGTGYIKAFTSTQSAWTTADGTGFPSNPASLQFGAGNVWWIGVGAAAGLTVGCIRALLKLDHIPSFLDELHEQHVDTWSGTCVAICATISLMGGASVGPEAGLGAAGGACGQLVNLVRGWWMATVRRRKTDSNQTAARSPAAWYAARVADAEQHAYSNGDGARPRMAVVAGMTGGFSCFLPSPITAVLLSAELSRLVLDADFFQYTPHAYRPPMTWGLTHTRMVIGLSLAATSAFIVYYAFNHETYLSPVLFLIGAVGSTTYNQISVVIGVLFGIMGAAMAVVYVLVGGVVQAVMKPVRAALDARVGVRARMVLLGLLGGTIMGSLSYACPLVIGDGSWQVGRIVLHAHANSHDRCLSCRW